MTKYLEIGQIVNTFGIRGMVKVKPFTDNIKKFSKFKTIYVKNKKEKKEYKIQEVKYHKDMVLIKFENVDTIEQAEHLRNSYLLIDRKQEEPLEQGTYYITDLIGIQVYTENDVLLGIIDDIYNTGSSDIYVVKDEQGKQILLPAISDVILKIDLENKKVIVHLIPGLI